MRQSELEAFAGKLPEVQRVDNKEMGYTFFFVGDDHRLPFVTTAWKDNDYDNVSDLNRDGVFRVNIGVSRETFEALVGDMKGAVVDYTVLNEFLPHPHYAPQNFVCILNPDGEKADETRRLIEEAHAIAAARNERRSK